MRLAFEDPALNDSFLFEYEFYFCSYLIFSECLVRAVIFFFFCLPGREKKDNTQMEVDCICTVHFTCCNQRKRNTLQSNRLITCSYQTSDCHSFQQIRQLLHPVTRLITSFYTVQTNTVIYHELVKTFSPRWPPRKKGPTFEQLS